MNYKHPVSVLVLVHTADLQVLLLERADRPGFWQSVTGSQDPGETLAETARRELAEETGIQVGPEVLVDWKLAPSLCTGCYPQYGTCLCADPSCDAGCGSRAA